MPLSVLIDGKHVIGIGSYSLYKNTSSEQTAIGYAALGSIASGYQNVALGFYSGYNLVNGANNIYLSSNGGGANENGTIRIGDAGAQTSTYIQGVYNANVAGGLLSISCRAASSASNSLPSATSTTSPIWASSRMRSNVCAR